MSSRGPFSTAGIVNSRTACSNQLARHYVRLFIFRDFRKTVYPPEQQGLVVVRRDYFLLTRNKHLHSTRGSCDGYPGISVDAGSERIAKYDRRKRSDFNY